MRWVFDPTAAYDIGKDFGVPILTFVLGMLAEHWREKRRRQGDNQARAEDAANTERRAADERRIANAPFFQVTENGVGNRGLELRAVNRGAPVICLDFRSVTPGYGIAPGAWHTDGDELIARVTIPPTGGTATCRLELRVRDRTGVERLFMIDLDTSRTPARRDFYEVPTQQPQN